MNSSDESFFKLFTTFAAVLYRIYIQTLALGSSLYIRYNTAAHVVNITYELLNFAMNLRTLQQSSEYICGQTFVKSTITHWVAALSP